MAKKKKDEVTIEETAVPTKDKFNLAKDIPIIHNRDELMEYIKPFYLVEDILYSHEIFNSNMKRLMNTLKGCFTIRALREFPIKFKFYKKDNTEYTLQLRHFCINLILWEPFVELKEYRVLDKSYILDCMKDIPRIEDYINYKLIEVLRDYNVSSTTINYNISEVLYNLRYISIDFSLVMGLNFSLKTFIDLYNNHETMHRLMESTFEKGLQPHEIEAKINEYETEEVSYLKSLPDNPIGIILRTNTGIKKKQLTEFMITEGLKPTLSGETIPININNSTLIRGLDRPSYYYLGAISSRKSLVLNKKVISGFVTTYSDVC